MSTGTMETLSDLLEHPPRAVKDRREHQPDARRRRNRPPTAKAEDPRQPRGMASGEQALEKLLTGVDRDKRNGARKPQSRERHGETRQRRMARERPTKGTQETTHGQRDHKDDPRDYRVQVGVALALELHPCGAAVREQISQLVHHQRRGRQQRHPRATADHPRATRTREHRRDTIDPAIRHRNSERARTRVRPGATPHNANASPSPNASQAPGPKIYPGFAAGRSRRSARGARSDSPYSDRPRNPDLAPRHFPNHESAATSQAGIGPGLAPALGRRPP